MSHVAPHRFAALAAGSLGPDEAQRIDAHVAVCARCATAQVRVLAGRGALAELGAAEPPALPWEGIGAKVHWTLSHERRVAAPPRPWAARLAWPAALAGVAAAAVVAIGAIGAWPAERAPLPLAALQAMPAGPVTPTLPAPAPAAAPLAGVITLAQGEVLVDGAPLSWDTPLLAGQRLTTGEGRVHVQFGAESAFVLEPRSVLELARFDAQGVELRVEGAVGVVLEKRAAAQRFVVLAAGRRVEVRGTVFRVAGGPDGLGVTVTRGRVAVVDGAIAVDVPAGSALTVPLAARLDGLAALPMGSAETRAAAERLRVHVLSSWEPGRSAPGEDLGLLRVGARPGQLVRVDGVDVALGAVELRLPAGRHQVAAAGEEPRWVELDQGARVDSRPPSRLVSERARQVEAQLVAQRARFEACANRARDITPDFAGELIFEVEITTEGAVGSVVAVQGLRDHDAEDCLLGIVRDQFTFPAGSRDIVRKVLRF